MQADIDARIVLVRHGETEWSSQGRHTGTTDVPLTAAGEAQARRIGQFIAGRSFGLALVSPMRRAAETAHLAGIREVETDPNLTEWNYGAFEGRTTVEIAAERGDDWTIWGSNAESGVVETADAVGGRTDAVLARVEPVLERSTDAILFAHGHLLRILAARWLGLRATSGALLALDAGSISELGSEHGRHVIWSWNLRP